MHSRARRHGAPPSARHHPAATAASHSPVINPHATP